jgi:hypothetical protein
VTARFERRIAGIEAALDALAPEPKPGSYEAFIAENPWIEWMTCDELTELEAIYRRAEEAGAATPADGERALAIMHASKARMLAGEPKDIDKPPVPFDVRLQAAYERNNAEYARRKRAMEAKGR